MLWVYSENDSFFAPALAASLYDAFTRTGGEAELTAQEFRPANGRSYRVRQPLGIEMCRRGAAARLTTRAEALFIANRMDPNGLSALEVHSNAKRDGGHSLRRDVTP